MNEDDVLSFIGNAIGSIWALELLLLLYRAPGTAWHEADLIAPLRANARVVAESLAALRGAGLTTSDETGRYRYSAASATLREAVDTLVELYARKPLAVTTAILSGRNDKIRTFADAFRLRK